MPTIKLSKYLAGFEKAWDAAHALQCLGLTEANYFLVRRWKKGLCKPSPAWVKLLAQKGIKA